MTPIAGPCLCGSAFGRIAAISGRSSDVFSYPGNLTVHPVVFWSSLGQIPEISEYQVHQTLAGVRASVVVDGTVDPEAITRRVEQGLRIAGLMDPIVERAWSTGSPVARPGKLRWFVPLANVPTE